MNTGAGSFWDREPAVRDLAAWGTDTGLTYAEIQEEIRTEFGDELVPSKTQIYGLRSGLARGRWMVPEEEPARATTKTQSLQEEQKGPDSVAATADRQAGKPAPQGEASPGISLGGSVSGVKPHFWDRNPEVRKVALAMIRWDYRSSAEQLERKFGQLGIEAGRRIFELRQGVRAGRWQRVSQELPAQRLPKRDCPERNATRQISDRPPLPGRVRDRLQQGLGECRIRGMPRITGRSCVLYQAGPGVIRTGKNEPTVVGRQVLHPRFYQCRDCPHWLSDSEYWAVKRTLKLSGKGALQAA
jgi:hypothetical protein